MGDVAESAHTYWRARHGLGVKTRPPVTPTMANAGAAGTGPPHCGNEMSKPWDGGAARVVAAGLTRTVTWRYHQPRDGECAYTVSVLSPGKRALVDTSADHPAADQSGRPS